MYYMEVEDLKKIVKSIVKKATILKNKHIEYKDTPINYACIFSQNDNNYKELLKVTRKIGKVIQETWFCVKFKEKSR